MKKIIYLDNAASTQLHKGVLEAMVPYLKECYLNPSALYASRQKQDLDNFRQRVALVLQVKKDEIVFTAGATEANNILISGVLAGDTKANIVISPFEHDSVSSVASQYHHKVAKLNSKNEIDLDDLYKIIDDNTILVCMIHTSNETGQIQPIRKIAQIITEVRKDRQKRGVKRPLYLHTDAAQAVYGGVNVSSLGVDSLVLNGSKIGGPKQSGCLFASRSISLTPILFGGSQERSLRPGTEALHQIAGFTEALEISNLNHDPDQAHLTHLRGYFEKMLEASGGEIVSKTNKRSPHITNVIFKGTDNETLANKLANCGIYVGIGSACHASKGQLSQVLEALGYSQALSRASLRFSYSTTTTKSELETTVQKLQELL